MRVLPLNRVVVASVWLLSVIAAGCVSPGELKDKKAFEAAIANNNVTGSVAGAGSPSTTPVAGSSSPAPVAAGSGAPTASAGCAMACDIIKSKCGACHGMNGQVGLDLTSPNVGTRLTNAKAAMGSECSGEVIINPTNPAASLLAKKVSATPGCGLSMPPGSPLKPEEVTCLQQWAAMPVCTP